MILTVRLAMFAKFAMYDQEKLPQFLEVGKLVAELAIFVVLFKLLKVATILQFVAWKSFGSLSSWSSPWLVKVLFWYGLSLSLVCLWYGFGMVMGMLIVCSCIQRHRKKT